MTAWRGRPKAPYSLASPSRRGLARQGPPATAVPAFGRRGKVALDEDLQEGGAEAPARPSKRRGARIRLQVCVSPEEAARIEDAARSAELSVSGYLRALGLGHRPMAVIDLDEALKLNHLGSNLGRLGGLLKLWVSEGPRPERYSEREFRTLINGLIDEVHANQAAMRKSVRQVLKAHPTIRRVRGAREGDGELDDDEAVA